VLRSCVSIMIEIGGLCHPLEPNGGMQPSSDADYRSAAPG
jgi:hypothetical protein